MMYILKITIKRFHTLVLSIFFTFLLIACGSESNHSDLVDEGQLIIPEPIDFGLQKIKERGKIIALIDNNSFSYFLYKGRPMGFEYELLKMLSEELKVELEIKIVKDIDKMFRMLNEGEGDIIAHNLTVTRERKEYVDFTRHLVLTKQVLVQRKPQGWRQMKVHNIKNKLIRTPLELIGKDVVVRKNSSFSKRLENLSDEIGGDINIIEADADVETDELIMRVVEGEIQYTVADKNVAMIIANEIPDIDISVELSTSQMIAWAVRKNADELLDTINNFINRKKQQATFNVLYRKYFNSVNRKDVKKLLYSFYEKKISSYDEILKASADSLNWDWLLLASMAYQESRFDPKAKSWVGARGLMQVMPATAKGFGYSGESLYDPKQNLQMATKYIRKLDKMWSKTVKDSVQRIKFVLASYNVGPGHVIDARNLARKYDKDPTIWDENVEVMLLKKAYKKYYTDPSVKHGYCRCYEPYNYVREIFQRYKSYLQLTQRDKEIDSDSVAL
ncbi:MAG: transporter substrate-binding domain-containing protein [Cytophagales bacterium]